MHGDLTLRQIKKEWHGTLKAYLIGFFICALLTIASFSLVVTRALSDSIVIYVLSLLAIFQAIIQFLFFFISDRKLNRVGKHSSWVL